MKRILWMVLMNLWYVPYGIIRLFQMAAHPERYSLEERYALIRQIDNRAIKGGRVVIQGDGMDRLPKDDGFILYPNHQGMFDVLAIIPFLKQVFACLGAYALDRSDPRQGMKVMLQMAEDVKNGRNFIIFPEGTRSRDGNHLLPFKGGSFKCATKANCPIVPVALLDSYKAFDTGSVAKQTVQVHFLDPIYPEEYQGMKTTQIAELVRTRIEEKIQACEMEKTE